MMRTLRRQPTDFPEPTRPRVPRRRLYPAGRVIAIVLLSLFFAALFDADSLVASISSERFGTSRTIELDLVRPFRTVSDALGLNLPHRWLAGIGGTNQPALPSLPLVASPPGSSTSPAALRTLLNPHLPTVTTPRTQRPPVPARTTTTRPAPPKPVVPTAAAPVRVWLAGDSLIGELAYAFIGHVAHNNTVGATMDMQVGTGLARPDVYNWPAAIAQEMQKGQPAVVILTFGANDDQDMQSGHNYYVRGTAAWQAEYARRVAQIMDEVATPGRMLIWLELPPVSRPQLQQNDQVVNAIVRAQAAHHPGVVVVDPTPVLSTNGAFMEYLSDGPGQSIQIRDTDGVHLTPAGAGRVLPLVLAVIRRVWAIS